jgi:hypothetical protein
MRGGPAPQVCIHSLGFFIESMLVAVLGANDAASYAEISFLILNSSAVTDFLF